MSRGDQRGASWRVHPALERAAAYSWRFLVVSAAVVVIAWLLRRLWVIVLALFIAVMLTRALIGPAKWMRRHGFPPAMAATCALIGFAAVLAGLGALIAPALVDEFREIGDTISEGLDDVERWLVEDAPVDITQSDVDKLRDEAGRALTDWVRTSSGSIVSGAVIVLEVLTGLLLAVITTFFMVKDGDRFEQWVIGGLPERHRGTAEALAARAWRTLAGYLRGAAILGLVEALVIGLTLWIVGANLVLPVMVITFLAAFVPFAGAVIAGVIAVLVALATASPGSAVVVALVALVVQQLDNDLLAPVVYGRSMELHPLMVLFSIVAASALFGPGGAVLAVPVVAVAINVASEWRQQRNSWSSDQEDGSAGAGAEPEGDV